MVLMFPARRMRRSRYVERITKCATSVGGAIGNSRIVWMAPFYAVTSQGLCLERVEGEAERKDMLGQSRQGRQKWLIPL